MSISKFSQNTANQLDSYVYIYSDPDTKQPFYIGKGKGNRVFAHLVLEGETRKIKKIQEIRAGGKEPLIEILVHGVDEETALKVEAAAIDLIGIENLTNEQRGHHSGTLGRKEVSALDALYNRKELSLEDISEPVMLIKINRIYRNDMSDFELYEATRGIWAVRLEEAQKVQYVFAVYAGMVAEVYVVAGWFPAGTTQYGTRADMNGEVSGGYSSRYEFIGKVAPENIRKKYLHKSVSNLTEPGARNPIRYINVKGKEQEIYSSKYPVDKPL